MSQENLLQSTVTHIQVAWGEMDAFQHVNNVYFFRYFESARIALFHRIQEQLDHKPEGHPVLASTSCDYKAPLFFPDTVICTTRIEKVGSSSMHLRMTLESQAQGREVASGTAVVVWFDPKTQRPLPWSPEMLKLISP